MPISAIAASLISSGVSAGGSATNAILQSRENRKNRQFQQHMYNLQRNDNLNQWHMQNAYNDPQQQMTRLRQAGLSPNLVYGSGANTTAQSISTSQGQAPNQQAPQIDTRGISEGILSIPQSQMIEQNIKLQQGQLKNIEAEILLKSAQTSKTLAETDTNQFNLGLQKELKDLTIDNIKKDNEQKNLSNKLLQLQVDFNTQSQPLDIIMKNKTIDKMALDIINQSLNNDMVKKQLTHEDLKMLYTAQQTLTSKETAENLKRNDELVALQTEIERIKLEMWKKGINPEDPQYQRVLMQLLAKALEQFGVNTETILTK